MPIVPGWPSSRWPQGRCPGSRARATRRCRRARPTAYEWAEKEGERTAFMENIAKLNKDPMGALEAME